MNSAMSARDSSGDVKKAIGYKSGIQAGHQRTYLESRLSHLKREDMEEKQDKDQALGSLCITNVLRRRRGGGSHKEEGEGAAGRWEGNLDPGSACCRKRKGGVLRHLGVVAHLGTLGVETGVPLQQVRRECVLRHLGGSRSP